MPLMRHYAVDLASAELECMASHVSNLTNICTEGGMTELQHGVEQLRAAVARIYSDIAASRAAKLH